jgi:hypothetical protein
MKYIYVFASAMAVCAAAFAGPAPNPADSSLSVPAATYASPFRSYRSASDDEQSPAATWRATNDNIAIHGGMQMDMGEMHMGEKNMPGTPMPMKGTGK